VVNVFILTDGKNYVMENPYKRGAYVSTTASSQAKEFTYKQARTLLQNKRKQISSIRYYHMVNLETGERENESLNYKGNGGVYAGDKVVPFDFAVVTNIFGEANAVVGLFGWSMTQLQTYEEKLQAVLSMYDSAESDIKA